ncbi:hypothetical protein NUW58_g9091 [Xylaria curta]|uniref:Uncharacterized protein n=1 Tax=Xylaria curta TaxID=42375 RepID=A0ACC1N311_9PEZI|nr:hypothetical protein NUW58_g9091 [Xylaria curta]
MCLLLDVMCSKTKSKSRTGAKTSKKQKCQECTTRRITREELSQMYLPSGPMPMPMPTMNQNQPGYNYGYGYSYGDWAAWEDSYPAMISNKQWKEHTQTAHSTYDSAQENGKKIGEMKSEIKEAQKSIEKTHASVNGTASQVKDMRDAINLTYVAVQEAHLAVQKTQNAINDKHAEHMSKQERRNMRRRDECRR